MKKFLPKFLILFAVILAVIGYYHFSVAPRLSGDLGKLAKIPFGEYGYKSFGRLRDSSHVFNCVKLSDIQNYRIVTVGDSFSQQGEFGYQKFLGELCGIDIGNVPRNNPIANPVADFVSLLNNGAFYRGQTVILESVERGIVSRLSQLDFAVDTLAPEGKKLQNPDNVIEETLRWLRLSLNFDNPVKRLQLDEDLFSNDKFSDDLFVTPGDFIFESIPADTLNHAGNKCDSLFRIAEKKGVNLFLLIAPDKYDVYENHIIGKHPMNHTLEWFSFSDRIIIPKAVMRKAIDSGVRDVYCANDTHCSEIGSRIMAEEVFSAIAPYLNDAF